MSLKSGDVVYLFFEGQRMKRLYPLLLIIAGAGLVVAGLLWNITNANECMKRADLVVGPMSRSQKCAAIR